VDFAPDCARTALAGISSLTNGHPGKGRFDMAVVPTMGWVWRPRGSRSVGWLGFGAGRDFESRVAVSLMMRALVSQCPGFVEGVRCLGTSVAGSAQRSLARASSRGRGPRPEPLTAVGGRSGHGAVAAAQGKPASSRAAAMVATFVGLAARGGAGGCGAGRAGRARRSAGCGSGRSRRPVFKSHAGLDLSRKPRVFVSCPSTAS
jgi:hypothetical protein